MKKILQAVILFLIPFCFFAQNNQNNITISFSNNSLEEAINKLETTSSCTFFYDIEWIQKTNNVISGEYTNTTVNRVIDDILKSTNLNYFINGKSVIFTKNALIIDKLDDNFFNANNTSLSKDGNDIKVEPVFNKQYTATTQGKSEVLNSIGKQNTNADQKIYILSGNVYDAQSEKTVPNINIKIAGSETSTHTDANGFYSIKMPSGVNTVQIISFNHLPSSKKVILYSDGKLDFKITENINSLEEIVIKSSQSKKANTAIAGVSTINIEDIKNIPLVLGERDIFKVATTLPGIKTTGEGSSGFNVRGGKDDQNLILLDNGVIYNPSHFLGFFSAVNPYTTKTADIYKGSIPAKFGGRLSSVFDVTSKKGNVEKFSGEGGIGPVMSNLALEMPVVKNKSSLILGLRATYSGWLLKTIDNEDLKDSNASFYDGMLKYDHAINKNNDIETSVYYSHDKFNITSDSIYKYSNQLATLKWDHTFNEKNKLSTIFTNSQYKFNINYDSDISNSFEYGYKIDETQILVRAQYLMNVNHKINYGASTKIYTNNPGYIFPTDNNSLINNINLDREKGIESAFFISDNYKISDKFLVDFGLRYSVFNAIGTSIQRIYDANFPKTNETVLEEKTFSNNEVAKTYGGIEPRLALRYLFNDYLSLKLSYDKNFQYIHLLSSNTTQSPIDSWKLSDINIKPQSANQYSIALTQNLKNDIEVSIEGYYKKSQNILDYKVGAELILNQNIETELIQGQGKSYGVELLVKKTSGILNGWIGYTYSRSLMKFNSEFKSETINNGDYFPSNYDKPHDFSAVLNYKFTKRYSFSTNFVYQTGRPITFPIGAYQHGSSIYTLYSDRNQYRIPDCFRLDVGFNFEGSHNLKKLTHSFWNISIYNVLGRNNPYSVYFVTENKQIKAYKTSIFAIPIPTITYNIKF